MKEHSQHPDGVILEPKFCVKYFEPSMPRGLVHAGNTIIPCISRPHVNVNDIYRVLHYQVKAIKPHQVLLGPIACLSP